MLVACLVALTFIDADAMLLPDAITLPLLWAGLLWSTLGGFVSLPDAVVGAAVGYLSLWSVYWVYKLAFGKEGFGYGDFKLLAALGAWFGWQAILPVILLSAVVGAVGRHHADRRWDARPWHRGCRSASTSRPRVC